MMTLQQKLVLHQLASTAKFNLSLQEMAAVLDAVSALTSEINAETAKKESSPEPAKGGDPAKKGVSK